VRAGKHEQARLRFRRRIGDVRRRPAQLLQVLSAERRLDLFELRDPRGRTDYLNPF
jgi:hypothetical protein